MGITAVGNDELEPIAARPIMIEWARNLLHDWFLWKNGYKDELPPDYEFEVEMFLQLYWSYFGKNTNRDTN